MDRIESNAAIATGMNKRLKEAVSATEPSSSVSYGRYTDLMDLVHPLQDKLHRFLERLKEEDKEGSIKKDVDSLSPEDKYSLGCTLEESLGRLDQYLRSLSGSDLANIFDKRGQGENGSHGKSMEISKDTLGDSPLVFSKSSKEHEKKTYKIFIDSELSAFKKAILRKYAPEGAYSSDSDSYSDSDSDSDSTEELETWDKDKLEAAFDGLINRYELKIIARKMLEKEALIAYRTSFDWENVGEALVELLSKSLKGKMALSPVDLLNKIKGIESPYAFILVAEDYLSREEVDKPENREIWEDEERCTTLFSAMKKYSFPYPERKGAGDIESPSRFTKWRSIDLWEAIKDLKNQWQIKVVSRKYLTLEKTKEGNFDWDQYGFEVSEKLRLKKIYDYATKEQLSDFFSEIRKEYPTRARAPKRARESS